MDDDLYPDASVDAPCPTSVSGTVYAPNGTLPLYGVTVYVPMNPPGPLQDGLTCGQCTTSLPGGSITQAKTDAEGKFKLENVPPGTDVPVIITTGKWRRQLTVPLVAKCVDNPVMDGAFRLPKDKSEGDIPQFAIATGSCDALECLLRKMGVADSEFTADSGDGQVHLYASNGATAVGSSTLSAASTLWGDLERMKQYDIMLFSCECGPRPAEKPQAYMDNLKAYADLGGRVFLSHYHSIWIEGEENVPTHAPAVWPQVATCNIDNYNSGTGVIDQVNNPNGSAFAQWMMAVGGSTTPGQVTITESRQSCSALDPTRAERWVYMNINGVDYPQNFQFTTPQEVAKENRCGKVVFSDMHVASGSSSSTPFPNGCSAAAMTPQEKALAFMLFEIGSCVDIIF